MILLSKYGKPHFLFLILFLFLNMLVHSQDSLLLTDQWTQLKKSIAHRHDLIGLIRIELKKGGTDIRRMADSAAGFSKRLSQAIDQQTLLSESAIDTLVQLNRQITVFLGRSFVLLENEPGKIKEKLMPLLAQLEGTENRIYIAANAYDKQCIQAGRPECRFRRETGEERAPQIKF